MRHFKLYQKRDENLWRLTEVEARETILMIKAQEQLKQPNNWCKSQHRGNTSTNNHHQNISRTENKNLRDYRS